VVVADGWMPVPPHAEIDTVEDRDRDREREREKAVGRGRGIGFSE
jgi:hypothetical protein